jgi:predicted TIM-barrel fold metal-dependent hydrolase
MQHCPPPEPNTRTPSFTPPPKSCDCALHIYGPLGVYPLSPKRVYDPHDLRVADVVKMHAVLGIERGVLVTPTVYGTDNRNLVDGLAEGGGRFRGVAVVDEQVTDKALMDMHAAGVRAIRCNMVRFLGRPHTPELMARLALRVAPLGWHIRIHIEPEELVEIAPMLRRLEVGIVFDHRANLDLSTDIGRRAHDCVVGLLGEGNFWIMLSNGDRMSKEGPPYADVVPLGRNLAAAAPDRVVWGTDWPHATYKKPRMVNDGDLLDLLAEYAPDPAARKKILVDNPQTLYGFDD